jgi:hypothetical protein
VELNLLSETALRRPLKNMVLGGLNMESNVGNISAMKLL